jgi:dihydropteroate synthase
MKNKTTLVPIINITPDSFSDGGKFFSEDFAVEQFKKLQFQGAEMIDIGGQSTRPGAEILSPKEEWARLEKPLSEISKIKGKTKISLDTYHVETARRGLDVGVDIINDVSGGNEEMAKLISSAKCQYIFMHNLGVPADKSKNIPENEDEITILKNWAVDKIKFFNDFGIANSQLIFDVGIGFGKTAEQSWNIIRNVRQFTSFFDSLGIDLMVGHSEKSFLSLITDKKAGERNIETAIMSAYLASENVAYIRVHDFEINARAIKAQAALKG